MRERVAFAPGGRMRSNLGPLGDERGVSPVIGAILVLALVIVAMSIYIGQVVPSYLRHNEAEHMNSVRGAFVDLQQLIVSRTDGTIELSMSPEPTPIFSLSPTSSKVEVTKARWVTRFQPSDDTYVSDDDQNSATGGQDGLLWIRSYQVGNAAYNRRIYTKFNLADNLPGISSQSIAEAWLVLYCEDLSKFTGAPWEDGRWDPKENALVDNFFLPDLPVTVEIREVSGMENWTEDTLTWNIAQGNFTIGDTIKAKDFPYEDNHTIKDNEAWFTWDVTSWVQDRVSKNRENVSFFLKAVHENATQDRYAVFSSEERDGSATVSNENETDNESNKATGHPPFSKPHLTVIYENASDNNPDEPLYDDWGPFVEGGTVRFDTDYREFPSHSFILEAGGLFQQQYGYAYEFMISDPGLVVGERLDSDTYGDSIAVYLNRYRIVNSDRITTSSDIKLKVTVKENTDYYVAGRHYPIDENGDGIIDPNCENVLITIHGSFEWPWKYYLRDLSTRWNNSASKGGLEWWVNYYGAEGASVWSGNVTDFIAKEYIDRNIRMYIWGRIEDPSVKDIYFYDRTYDVEVNIIV